MPKDFENFFSLVKAESTIFWANLVEFRNQKSLAICTTVVQLSILRVSQSNPLKVWQIGSGHSSIKNRPLNCVAFLINKRARPLHSSKISSQIFKKMFSIHY